MVRATHKKMKQLQVFCFCSFSGCTCFYLKNEDSFFRNAFFHLKKKVVLACFVELNFLLNRLILLCFDNSDSVYLFIYFAFRVHSQQIFYDKTTNVIVKHILFIYLFCIAENHNFLHATIYTLRGYIYR